MTITRLYDRLAIEQFLRKNTPAHLYSIGDLDDFMWPYTIWYALVEEGTILALALLFTGTTPPTFLAFTQENAEYASSLVHQLLSLLPQKLYVHISPDLVPLLSSGYTLISCGLHYKMMLTDAHAVEVVDTSRTNLLTPKHTEELLTLFAESYPDNWFNPRMLETGMYAGIRLGGRLVSAAGVHVFSPRYGVAALGNIVTHPHWRGNGFGTMVTARVCQELLRHVSHIGLHVGVENDAALACYQKTGFTIAGLYEEYSAEKHRHGKQEFDEGIHK